jgi:hypothetical protein
MRQVVASVAAGGVLLAVVIVGIGLGWLNATPSGGAPPAHRLAVSTSLEPHPAFYGDVLTAEIDVEINSADVAAKSVRVVPGFGPYVETNPPKVTESGVGSDRTLRYRYSIQCVSEFCLPGAKPFALQIPPVTVTAKAGSQQLKATATWPTTFIASRLTAKDIARTHFRFAKTVPAPKYTVPPGTLAGLLTAAAGILAVAALALIGFELVRLVERRRRRALVVLTPLETALAYTRDAARRPDAADRRRALGLLAKTLDSEGVATTLADTAADVAWSEEPPTPDRAIELADEVESTAKDAQ